MKAVALANVTLVVLFFTLMHPLLLVMVLTLQTLPIVTLILYVYENSWVAYMLFLIFLGGLLIIFIYLSALIPNEVFNMSEAYMTAIATLMIANLLMKTTQMQATNSSMTKIMDFSTNNTMSTIPLVILYLLMGLSVTMLMCVQLKSPLKQQA